MVKNIIFHLGDLKTGSTSIQETLATQNWICADKSIIYPAKINHIPLARSISKNGSPQARDRQFKAVKALIDDSNADIAIISAEFFEWVDPELLKKAVQEYFPDLADTARYISYVRPHADRLVSSYGERIKGGFFLGTLEEMHQETAKSKRFIYFDRFMKWRNVFGNRFTLHPMIRKELDQNCVVRDFLNFAFEGAPFHLVEEPKSNQALSVEDLAMLRELHVNLPDKPGYRKARIAIGLNFSRILAAMPCEKHTKLGMPQSMVENVIETYLDDAEKLDAEFFDNTPMMDALLANRQKAVDSKQSVLATDHFDQGGLRMIHAWADLVIAMSKMKPKALANHLRELQKRKLNRVGNKLGKKRKQGVMALKAQNKGTNHG